MQKSTIVNETNIVVPEEVIQKCSEEVAQTYYQKPYRYTVVFVDPDKIKELNRKYYKKDSVTDVLTFEEAEDEYLGEVVVCPEYIKKKYTKDKFNWEICHAVVHGTFHLIGMHHEDMPGGHEDIHKKEIEIINKYLA